MSVRTETLQLRVLIDGSPARKELATLDQEYAKINSGLKNLTKGTKEYVAATERLGAIRGRQEELRQEIGLTSLTAKQLGDELRRLQVIQRNATPNTEMWAANAQRINEVKARLKELNDVNVQAAAAWEQQRKNIRLTDMTMAQLEAESKRLRAILRDTAPNTPEFARYSAELNRVETRTRQLASGTSALGRVYQTVKGQIMGAFAVLGTLFAGSVLLTGIRNLVSGSADLSDELANVQKASGKTKEEVAQLNREIGRIDTRTANKDLREIAVGLGQAGEDVSAAAVAAVDKINVALGDEFGEGAKEITGTLSTLRNNLGDIKSGDYATDVGRIGNALNVLGANGLATAPVVSDIANRVAGAAQTFKIASGNTLGLAATFQELGINVERGSTAYVRILQKIASEPEKFARIVRAAGLDVDLFRRQVNDDMQAAFVTVAKAARIAGTSNTAYAASLGEMETEGIGVSELLSKIGANQELLAAKSKLATEALTNQNSITEEARLKNSTLGAQLEKLGKVFNSLFTSKTVVDSIASVVEGLREMVDWLKANRDAIVFVLKVLGNATVAWASYRLAVLASSAASKIAGAAQLAYGTLMQLLTGKINLATVATKAFNVATKLNPVGLLIAGVTTLITLFASFGEEVEMAKVRVQGLAAQDRDAAAAALALHRQIMQTKQGSEERRRVIEQLQAQYPEYLSNLDAENTSNQDLVESMKDVNRELIRRASLMNDLLNMNTEELGGASTKDLQASVSALKDELDGLSEASFNAQDALANGRFKPPTLETTARPEGLPADAFFLDTAALNRNSEQGQRNIKKVFDAYKIFLAEERQRLEDELNRRNGSGGGGAAGLLGADDKKMVEELQGIRATMLAERRQLELDALSADERQLAQIDDKYATLRATLVENEQHTAEDLRSLDETHANERANAIAEQGERRIALAQEIAEKSAQAEQEAKDKVFLDQLGQEDLEITQQMQRMDELVALYEAAGIDTRQVVEKTEKAIANIRKKYRDQEQKSAGELREQAIQNQIAIYQGVGAALSGVNALLAATYSAQLENNYKNTVGAKALGLAQIAISTAVGVAEAIKAGAGIPWPGNLAAIASGVGAVLSGIASAITLMRDVPKPDTSMESPSSTSTGGGPRNIPLGAKGGIFEGPSHANGGLKVYDPIAERVVAEVEGDEPWMVLSKVFREKNADIIPLLLRASASGERLQLASSGGIFAPTPRFNFAKASESMRIVHMAQGGIYTFRKGAGINGSDNTNYTFTKGNGGIRDADNEADGTSARFATAVEQFTKVVAQFPTEVRAKSVLQDEDRRRSEHDLILRETGVRKAS